MRKPFIKHSNLRKLIEEIYFEQENRNEYLFEKFINELKHSCLIAACDKKEDSFDFVGIEVDNNDYGLLFTDMDEFRKTFPNDECLSQEFEFKIYQQVVKNSMIDGFILNIESEGFILKKGLFLKIEDFPEFEFDSSHALTSEGLLEMKNNINNSNLEEFIENPSNIGKYEELFEKISSSTMLTLMLSDMDLTEIADDGIISMTETGPLGFLYTDEVGGEYATAFTSEDKIFAVETPLYKYSQIVNFSQLTNFVLNDDMDGIIINPGTEHVVLGRDVLLEFYQIIEKTCNDSRLNSAIFHMFLIGEG